MSQYSKKREMYPRVEDLYNGKSVFITGAGGFVGMILLEILLRTCPGINFIYILMRAKKGVQPEQRKEKLFQKVIFEELKADHPDALDKVRLVSGDVSLPDLGMSEQHVQEIVQNVSIVFHCAADISFVKSLKCLMGVNTLGTYYVVELCKKLKELDALVYTSTICSNANRKDEIIDEQVYRLPFVSQRFLQEFKEGSDESLEQLVSLCHPHWPNSYTFNKCLAENILLENASEVPSAIIRPSLVGSTWKTTHPGFFERNSSLALLTTGSGKGFIKVLLLDPDNNIDFVPADIVANAHVVAAWRVATGRSAAPFIVNCSSYGTITSTWTEFRDKMLLMQQEYPLPNRFRPADSVTLVTSVPMYRLLTFYKHYVPAYVIDFILKLSGKKFRLVPLYRLFDKAMITASFFTVTRGKYDTTNFRTLDEGLDETDKKKFYTDITELTLQKFIDDLPHGGNEVFDWTKDRMTKEARQKKADQRKRFSQFIKYAFLLIMFTTVYLVTSKTYQLLGLS